MWEIRYAVENLDVVRLREERVRPEPGRDIKCAATTRYATGNDVHIPEMPRFAIISATNGITLVRNASFRVAGEAYKRGRVTPV